jgi:hypothetical protein
MNTKIRSVLLAAASVAVVAALAPADDLEPIAGAPDERPAVSPAMLAKMRAQGQKQEDEQLPKLKDVAEGYEKVVSTADGRSMYTVWTREKDAQMLAELPRNFEQQKLFIAYTIAGGTRTAGVQTGDLYAFWKRFDKRLALIQPNYQVRSTGDLESKKGLERVFTDRVILDVPIVARGEGGGPVIDMDQLLLGQARSFFGPRVASANTRLARIAKAKAFPENIELAYELPLFGGQFGTLHYSISVLPKSTGYKPREADARVGYFVTTYRDIGHPSRETPAVRYINRWKLEKADASLKLSPPKEPIVFYLEHTIPVRYRRWVREGVLEWNKAFEKVGIVNAIEVYQQDARTGAHMEKDPEDARYNFVLWTNANMGFAIGPSRVDPRTGQILDADIVMDEGFVTGWVNTWRKLIPETAMLNFGPQTLAWLEDRPQWDPRVRLAPPAERADTVRHLRQERLRTHGRNYAGHPAGNVDATIMGDDRYDGLAGRVSQINGRCDCAAHVSQDIAFYRMAPDLLYDLIFNAVEEDKDEDADAEDKNGDKDDEDEKDDAEETEEDGDDKKRNDQQMIDGVPESFIGPLLRDVIMHEVGHTLGLRHNFKASTIYSLEQVNSPEFKGRPITGSVMDYNPININFEDGPEQGEFAMVTIGPYDYWAIEYGYTFEKNLEPILARVSEPELIYGTDEDSWGSDPRARTFDFGANPLNYADSQMRLIQHLRGELLDRVVKKGESWAKVREAYQMLLGKHMSAVSIAANWVGGTYSNRDRKGDPGDRVSVQPVPADQQRRALRFVIDNAFNDDAFGLTEELLSRMTVDKWWDDSSLFSDPAWPVHDRILAIQSVAMTMLMNPTTLNRVLDNEYRESADKDALTLPELMETVNATVWSELDGAEAKSYTARKPMITSLRRNLQREHLERLIDLSLPNDGLGAAAKPIANLATYDLRRLDERIGQVLGDLESKLDPYSRAHLAEARVRIQQALDAQYIYNTDDISAGGGIPLMFFGRDAATEPPTDHGF